MTTHDLAATAAWGEPRTKTVTWTDPFASTALMELSGRAMLEGIMRGELAEPPIASLLGFRILEVDLGRIVFACDPDESTYNPLRVGHGGLVCTLADTVCGCAVHTTLEAGVGYTSIDINVTYLRPVTVDSGTLVATGVATKVGRRVGFAEARIIDGAGREVATATSSLLVMHPSA
jgi:uncharacterized protein (TIGR00369 family)